MSFSSTSSPWLIFPVMFAVLTFDPYYLFMLYIIHPIIHDFVTMSRSTSAAAPEAGALLNCLWTVRTVGNWMALGVCAYIQYLSLSINPIKNIQYMFFTLKGLSVLAIHCWAVGLHPYTVSSKDASLGIFLLMVLGHLKLWVDTARIALEFTFQTALVSYLDTLGYGYIQTYTQTLKFFYWELFKGKVGIGQTPIDSLFPDPKLEWALVFGRIGLVLKLSAAIYLVMGLLIPDKPKRRL